MYGICVGIGSPMEKKQWHHLAMNFSLDLRQIWLRGEEHLVGDKSQVVQTAEELPADRPLVVLSPIGARLISGKTSIVDFEHPKDAIYFFGTNSRFMSPEEDFGTRVPEHVVYIPVERDLYSWTSGAIVLYDRLSKMMR